jgi:hypothetical protein
MKSLQQNKLSLTLNVSLIPWQICGDVVCKPIKRTRTLEEVFQSSF